MLDKRTVEIHFQDSVLVEKEGVKQVYKMLDEFTDGQRLKKLLIIGEHTDITKEARLLIVEENNVRKNRIVAEAIVVHSFAQKLIANFYLALLKNIYPIQFFTERTKAEKWLRSH
jgi:hypothetical protein